MTTESRNNAYVNLEQGLWILGYRNIKRWVEYNPHYMITALEVYCSPILIDDHVKRLRWAFSAFNITGNTNQSYILIRLL